MLRLFETPKNRFPVFIWDFPDIVIKILFISNNT